MKISLRATNTTCSAVVILLISEGAYLLYTHLWCATVVWGFHAPWREEAQSYALRKECCVFYTQLVVTLLLLLLGELRLRARGSNLAIRVRAR